LLAAEVAIILLVSGLVVVDQYSDSPVISLFIGFN